MRAFLCLFILALTAGCATTSGEPVFRLRPKVNEETGQRDKAYKGNADIVFTVPDYDSGSGTPNGFGLRVNARRSNWYVAPEIGFGFVDEGEQGDTADVFDVFAGGRVAARFTEIPVEVFANGGVSFLDSDVFVPSAGIDKDETNVGYYVGVGSYLYLGSSEGAALGLAYRYVGQDWVLDPYGEFSISLGWAW
jgi:hypothetical protein